jgi:hypothetical protein
MKTTFKDMELRQVFWVSPENSEMNTQYRKISKSRAECCDMIGYGNKRGVDHTATFSPFKTVYIFAI